MTAAVPLRVEVRQKRFPNGWLAVRDLALDVAPGEFVALVGPSGAGKSTLLNLIAGLDADFDGQLQGVPKGRLGFMFQEARLMPWLTAQDNLKLVAPEASTAQIRELLEAVELAPFANAYPGQLSGGMAKRLAMARAFAVDPELLLMDEPFSGLDAPTAGRLRQLLENLCQRTRPSVLLVTHQLNEALAMADRVVFLSAAPARVVLSMRPEPVAGASADLRLVQAQADRCLAQYPQLLQGDATPA